MKTAPGISGAVFILRGLTDFPKRYSPDRIDEKVWNEVCYND